MRKVIGIGETILDILFNGNQPTAAIPGGSVFNGIVSLARMGADVTFIGETGNDRVGRIIREYMEANGVPTDHLNLFSDGRSPVSLAFLDEHRDAEYLFYKDYPRQRLEFTLPRIEEDDILLFGSYYALNPVLREKIAGLLEYARERKALIYYDVNFRSTHSQEAIRLTPTLIENFEYADLVRGSADDFRNLYGTPDADAVYREKIRFYCPGFICTAGAEGISLRTATVKKEYPVEPLEAVSTVGAGDNFNAGLIYGLLKYRVRRADLAGLTEKEWDRLIRCGMDFSAEACRNIGNSISREFADAYQRD